MLRSCTSVILRCARVPYNSTQHEPDHRENDECCVIAAEIFVVFDESAAPDGLSDCGRNYCSAETRLPSYTLRPLSPG
jgi:hypothetical protein